MCWMWPTLSKYMSVDQLGGQTGSGTNHYIARLIQFINTELDGGGKSDSSAVIAMAIDLAKAFNRLDHCKVITICVDIGVPICAVRLLCSYLSGRRMRVHHNGVMSSVYDLPGGGPQGALLTVLLFNLNSNWLTDVCQPGILAESRFLGEFVPVTAPRDASAQSTSPI